jgi:hypothetical protein
VPDGRSQEPRKEIEMMEKLLDVEAAGYAAGNWEEGEDVNNPYDFHYWSEVYREERLREAGARRLEGRLQANGEIGAFSAYEGTRVWSMRHVALVIAVAAIIAASAIFSAPAFASHEHYLETPGNCVEDVASGQTEKGEGEGGYHKFHDNVHKGQPGTEAFEKENNPVSVDKGSCPAQH